MPLRKLIVSPLSLVALICAITASIQAEGRARPFRDYLVKAYPAQMRLDLPEDSLLKLRHSAHCSDSPFFLLQSVLPRETDNRAVYAVHLGSWESRGGTFALKSSRWYVFRLIVKHGNAGDSCTFVQTGFNADGTPLIYADKTVWLLGVDYFAGAADPAVISLGYKLANVPVPPQNIQDLGALVAGVLGASPNVGGAAVAALAAIGGGPGAPPKPVKKVTSYITVAKFDFMERFPRSLSFSFSLAVNLLGGLPPARIGVPYSASVSASGGNGAYSFTLSDKGSMPPGIGLDPTSGAISGTPTAAEAGKYQFSVKVSDTSSPPNETTVTTSIELSDSVVVQPITLPSPLPDKPTIANATATRLPDARIGSPYSVILMPSLALTDYKLSVDIEHSLNAKWASFNPASRLIRGTPDKGQSGPTQLIIDITDPLGKLIAIISASLTVWPLPSGAESNAFVTSLADSTVGEPYFSGLALGPLASNSNATLVQTGDLPDGITFSSTTGTISGTALGLKKKSDAGETFVFAIEVVPSQPTGGQTQSPSPTSLAFSLHVNPAKQSHAEADVTVDFFAKSIKGEFPSTVFVGQAYVATLKIIGSPGPYLVLSQCKAQRSRDGEQFDSGKPECKPPDWFYLPHSIELPVPISQVPQQPPLSQIGNPGGSAPPPTTQEPPVPNETSQPRAEVVQFLSATPLVSGQVTLAIEICRESPDSIKKDAEGERNNKNKIYSESDCVAPGAPLKGEINVQDRPLQPIVVTLGSSTPQSPSGPNSRGGPAQSGPAGGPQSANSSGPGSPSSGPQTNGGGPSKNSGGGTPNPGSAPASSAINPQSVDCSVVSAQAPCTFTDTFVNNDREAFDFSVGVTLPGVKEAQFTAPTAMPKIVTHTDFYALVDLYPLAIIQHFTDWSAIAYMPSKESWVPHFNFGIPIASQPFHRPYFGVAENLTTWTKAEKYGFPFRVNGFVGLVSLKQQIVTGSSGSQTLIYDRAWKPAFGIEVPIAPLVSKLSSALSGGGSKSSPSTSGH